MSYDESLRWTSARGEKRRDKAQSVKSQKHLGARSRTAFATGPAVASHDDVMRRLLTMPAPRSVDGERDTKAAKSRNAAKRARRSGRC